MAAKFYLQVVDLAGALEQSDHMMAASYLQVLAWLGPSSNLRRGTAVDCILRQN